MNIKIEIETLEQNRGVNMKRVTSGMLGFSIISALLIFGNKYIVDAMFCIVAMFCIHEFYKSFKETAKPIKWVRIYICIINSFYTYYTNRILNSDNKVKCAINYACSICIYNSNKHESDS